jgi:hypothetical protein
MKEREKRRERKEEREKKKKKIEMTGTYPIFFLGFEVSCYVKIVHFCCQEYHIRVGQVI